MTSSSRLNQIQIDTREKKNGFIEQYIEYKGFPYIRSKMHVGDYMFRCNPYYVIDRKKNMSELYGNLTQQHKRFRNEMLQAQATNTKLVILIQDEEIKRLEDVKTWENPQSKFSDKALDGYEVYRRLDKMRQVYDCEFVFATRDEYASTVLHLLEDARDKWLNGIKEIYL